jgi:hypothetical protein
MAKDTDPIDLGEYKGLIVKSTKVVVTKLGDGLSNPVAVEPIIIELGNSAYLAIRVKKVKDRYEVILDDEGDVTGVTLVQMFESTGAHFVDGAKVSKGIDAHVAKVRAAEELKKSGQDAFDFEDDDTDGADLPRAKRDRLKHPDLAKAVDEATAL